MRKRRRAVENRRPGLAVDLLQVGVEELAVFAWDVGLTTAVDGLTDAAGGLAAPTGSGTPLSTIAGRLRRTMRKLRVNSRTELPFEKLGMTKMTMAGARSQPA
jgi:hypothetical protein